MMGIPGKLIYGLQARLLILWYRLARPPRLLRFHSVVNIALLRAFGATVGEAVNLQPPLVIHGVDRSYAHLTIGNRCSVSGNNYLDITGQLTLEDGVSLGPGVIIMTHNSYNENAYLLEQLRHTCGVGAVIVRRGAGIKAGAILTMGVTVGEDSVVAAGTLVNKDVPARHVTMTLPERQLVAIE